MLGEMEQRLYGSATFETAVKAILADVVALQGAEFGNVQLAAEAKLIVVAKPFPSAILAGIPRGSYDRWLRLWPSMENR